MANVPPTPEQSPHDEHEPQLEGLVVRRFEGGDHAEVARLYGEGMLAGQIAPNDTAADIEDIEAAYFGDPASYFWVAELGGKIVGMIGVANEDQHVAEIRRLRVDPLWQKSGLAWRLIETAITHCRKHDYLKVVLDTRFERHAALNVFERFGFQHTRTRNTPDKELLEFYLDLYRSSDPRNPRNGDGNGAKKD
ncbi:MAG: GNAT family N-acetyltransferase [Phycisphaeraceae bacterium]|nr:GNAT family N-acetyltransferase [Phycisphaeraceae bacterium]